MGDNDILHFLYIFNIRIIINSIVLCTTRDPKKNSSWCTMILEKANPYP